MSAHLRICLRAAPFAGRLFSLAFLLEKGASRKVFNTSVENSVEKHDGISVSDSAENGSAFCTGAGAGTFVVS
jgi:hypothetical protein